MEITADPQPSSLCLTNGTPSHTPGFSWGAGWIERPRKRSTSKPRAIRFIRVRYNSESRELAEHDRKDNDTERDHDDPQEITVGYASCREIAPRPAGPLREFGKIFIA